MKYITDFIARLADGNILGIVVNSSTSSDIPGEFFKVLGTPSQINNLTATTNPYDTKDEKIKINKKEKLKLLCWLY